MAWTIDFSGTAERQLKKLDRQWQRAILDYLEDEIAPLDNPRQRGKALVGDKKGLWRYRINDYRVICQILDTELVILALAIAHRKDVYK
ncbi:addiction module toxin RelE [Marispirochaeta aestuarii]|uniref:Addiction module toxin RelE n=1 Tax=Marispirochaeta aestuarii TaxID=1963862 RepID=A0A1Y1RST8_9SPIO|nr:MULTISPECIES: type II toxin-antitoxin system RelE/ParE family toxin [Marispirochaeta]ORC29586.1 addiction module toxin RelE [Marispirochaeta aestuarii]